MMRVIDRPTSTIVSTGTVVSAICHVSVAEECFKQTHSTFELLYESYRPISYIISWRQWQSIHEKICYSVRLIAAKCTRVSLIDRFDYCWRFQSTAVVLRWILMHSVWFWNHSFLLSYSFCTEMTLAEIEPSFLHWEVWVGYVHFEGCSSVVTWYLEVKQLIISWLMLYIFND